MKVVDFYSVAIICFRRMALKERNVNRLCAIDSICVNTVFTRSAVDTFCVSGRSIEEFNFHTQDEDLRF